VLETSDDNYVGRGVHETERIKEQAASDEVLVGLAALEAAGNGFPRSDVRFVSLRGFPEPVELVSLRGGSRVVSADVTADQ